MHTDTNYPRTDAALAHDLTNYLTAISGLAQVGRLIKSAEAKDAYMVRIESAVQDMASMLRTALAQQPRDPRCLLSGPAMVGLIEEVIEYQQSRFRSRGVDLGWQPRPPLPECRVAPMSLKQAAVHLIDNALRATPDGGRVTVRLAACSRPSGVLSRVQDTGPGIPKQLPSQAGYTTQADGNGLGLGLPVAREIIELMHGGRLSLRSRKGLGTTANAFLPA